MRGHMVGAWALLGLLLVCLHLPGLFARSISAVGEEVPRALPGLGSPSLARPPNSEHAQPKPEAGSNGLARDPLKPQTSPLDGTQPAGGPWVQNLPFSGVLPSLDSWPPEEDWPVIAAAAEDQAGDVPPAEGLPYLTNAAALPLGSHPLPEGSSAPSAGTSLDSSLVPREPENRRLRCFLPPGAQGGISAQRPPWSLINRILHPSLPGHPWGTLNPGVSWGGGRLGTGWGTRPMPPFQAGNWGITNQYPGTSWGSINRYPVGSWGNNNQYPGGSWGSIHQSPGATGGNTHLPSGAHNRLPPRILRPPGSFWDIPANSPNSQDPGVQWGSWDPLVLRPPALLFSEAHAPLPVLAAQLRL
ncbi:uncharacterized protein C6orf15 homolog [Echinops telfairi]|uniref:Uncharacterized protein C6orf15 homolog n=1 Tax=Echinops telfairi TaxID=9371 RepID=A0AC55D8X0_ECHTE|nr:uncharacterized protein C6orf15 homolog [Echinops telfairi]